MSQGKADQLAIFGQRGCVHAQQPGRLARQALVGQQRELEKRAVAIFGRGQLAVLEVFALAY
jgi:hypothetical protein